MKIHSLRPLPVLAAAFLAGISICFGGPMPKVGDKAPPVEGKDQDGKTWRLADETGKKAVLLYFYPKDATPGCTKEACGFRDGQKKLQKAGAVVLGVSPQGEASHKKFADKCELPFQLRVDEDHALAEKFGAWGERSLYGRKFMGVIRSTF